MNKRIISFLNKHSLFSFKRLLLISSILIAFLSLGAVGIHSYYWTVNFIFEKVESSNAGKLIQTANAIENNLSLARNIARNIASSEFIIDCIKEYEADSFSDRRDARDKILPFLTKIRMFNNSISSIVVFIDSDVFFIGNDVFYDITNKDIKNSEFNKLLEKTCQDMPCFIEPSVPDSQQNHSNPLNLLRINYSFASKIEKHGIEYGSVFVILEPQFIDDIIDKDKEFLILNGTRKVLWQSAQLSYSDIETILIDISNISTISNIEKVSKRNMNIYLTQLPFNDWNLVYLHKIDEVSKKISTLRIFILTSFIITVLIAFFLSDTISKRISKPISQLVTSIRRFRIDKQYNSFYIDEEYTPRISMREKLLYYLITVVILPLLIYMIFSYMFFADLIKEHIIESNIDTFRQTAQNLDSYLKNKLTIINGIIFDNTIQTSLIDSDVKDITNFYKTVDNYLLLHEGEDDIFIYKPDGQLFFTNDNNLSYRSIDQKTFEHLINSSKVYTWMSPRIGPRGQIFMNLFAKINDEKKYKTIGYLQCQFNEYYLENIFRSIVNPESNIFIVNDNNTIISHIDKNLINTTFNFSPDKIINDLYMADKNSFVLKTPLENTSWYLVGQYRNTIFDKDIQKLIYEGLYILIIIMFSVILISFMFSYSFTSSINIMREQLKKMNIDNMDIYFPENSKILEIRELGTAFNDMVLRTESLLDQILITTKKQNELENRKKEAELIALQAQINPHFLYNTFESINWMIKCDEKQFATRMITNLSDMLRYIAKSKDVLVTVFEELQYLRTYTEIMLVRFNDSLKFNWNIDENLLNFKVIKLVLQPIVENAIYHGINPKLQSGVIEIGCYEDGNNIFFSISDNGVGIDEVTLNRLNEILDKKDYSGKIGLYNVHNRIKLAFGEQYGLNIESTYGKGTVVKIRMPRIIL